MSIVIVGKANGSTAEVEFGNVLLQHPSAVKINIGPEQVAGYQQSGNDLVLILKNGQTITIVNFFVVEDAQRSELVLQDDEGVLWWGQYTSPWSDFQFAEINLAEGAAAIIPPTDGGFAWWIPLLGLLGVGAAIAAGSGGSDGDDGAVAPAKPVVTDTTVKPGSEPGNVIIAGKTDPQFEGAEVGIVDEAGNPILDPETSEPITGKVGPGGEIEVNVPEGALPDGKTPNIVVTPEGGEPSEPAPVPVERPAAPVVEIDGPLVPQGELTTPVTGRIFPPASGLIPEDVFLRVGDNEPVRIPKESLVEQPDGSFTFTVDVPSDALKPGTPVTVESNVRDPETGLISGPGETQSPVTPPAPEVTLGEIVPGDGTQTPVTGMIVVTPGSEPTEVVVRIGEKEYPVADSDLEKVDDNGNYSFTVPVDTVELVPGVTVEVEGKAKVPGTELVSEAAEDDGQVLPPAPEVTLGEIVPGDGAQTLVTGTIVVTPGSEPTEVVVRIGEKEYLVAEGDLEKVDDNGNYSFTVPVDTVDLVPGVTVEVEGKAKVPGTELVSEAAEDDGQVLPPAPEVTLGEIVPGDGVQTLVTGTIVVTPGSEPTEVVVRIGEKEYLVADGDLEKVDDNGNYSFTVPVDTVDLVPGAQVDAEAKAQVPSTELVSGIAYAPPQSFGVEDGEPIAILLKAGDIHTDYVITKLPENGRLYKDAELTEEISLNEEIESNTTLYFAPSPDWSGSTQFDYIIKGAATGTDALTANLQVRPVTDTPRSTADIDFEVEGTSFKTYTWDGVTTVDDFNLIKNGGAGADPGDLVAAIDILRARGGAQESTTQSLSSEDLPEHQAKLITGFVYLEAGKTYSYQGAVDDSGVILIGEDRMGYASYGGADLEAQSFTIEESGFYTFDLYLHNAQAIGNYDFSVVEMQADGSTSEVQYFGSKEDIDTAIAKFGYLSLSDFNDVDNDGNGHYALKYGYSNSEPGEIKLTGAEASLTDTDGSETLTMKLVGLAPGAVLTYNATNIESGIREGLQATANEEGEITVVGVPGDIKFSDMTLNIAAGNYENVKLIVTAKDGSASEEVSEFAFAVQSKGSETATPETGPEAEITLLDGDNAASLLIANKPVTVKVTFDKPVDKATFDATDIKVTGAEAPGLFDLESILWNTQGTAFTISFTPSENAKGESLIFAVADASYAGVNGISGTGGQTEAVKVNTPPTLVLKVEEGTIEYDVNPVDTGFSSEDQFKEKWETGGYDSIWPAFGDNYLSLNADGGSHTQVLKESLTLGAQDAIAIKLSWNNGWSGGNSGTQSTLVISYGKGEPTSPLDQFGELFTVSTPEPTDQADAGLPYSEDIAYAIIKAANGTQISLDGGLTWVSEARILSWTSKLDPEKPLGQFTHGWQEQTLFDPDTMAEQILIRVPDELRDPENKLRVDWSAGSGGVGDDFQLVSVGKAVAPPESGEGSSNKLEYDPEGSADPVDAAKTLLKSVTIAEVDTDQQIRSATITLTDAKEGDLLWIAGSTGVTGEIDNVVSYTLGKVGTGLTLNLTLKDDAALTVDDWNALLQKLNFGTSSSELGERTINISVSDGYESSNVESFKVDVKSGANAEDLPFTLDEASPDIASSAAFGLDGIDSLAENEPTSSLDEGKLPELNSLLSAIPTDEDSVTLPSGDADISAPSTPLPDTTLYVPPTNPLEDDLQQPMLTVV